MCWSHVDLNKYRTDASSIASWEAMKSANSSGAGSHGTDALSKYLECVGLRLALRRPTLLKRQVLPEVRQDLVFPLTHHVTSVITRAHAELMWNA